MVLVRSACLDHRASLAQLLMNLSCHNQADVLGIWLKFASEIPYGLRHDSLAGSCERMLFGQEMLRISTGIADRSVDVTGDIASAGSRQNLKLFARYTRAIEILRSFPISVGVPDRAKSERRMIGDAPFAPKSITGAN